ncbi:short chain dehydrogenase [Kalaharituber pfeilii]|nr:short chain dehydrogenase [Kalaharituber pfeilii]
MVTESTSVSAPGPLSGKVCIVTGGSKGIGKAIALQLAKDGASVVINYSRDAAAAEEVVKAIGEGQAIAVKGDAGSVEDIRNLVTKTIETFGRLDSAICNAGIMEMKTIDSTTEEDWDRSFGVNVKGPFFLAQEAAKHLQTGGSILFFSTSILGFSLVQPAYLLYASTKGAVEQMTRVLAKDLGRRGITVNCVAPGPTATELFLKGKTEEQITFMEKAAPGGRLGRPEDVAGLVRYLVGPEAAWINGQVVRVNGGLA